jgi:leucyl/phenylalanyl-tRNA--protein transferase
MASVHRFPDPRDADDEGVVAVGGPLKAKRLLAAYRQGIFPWSGEPVRWHSPDPRSIFWEVKLPRKLGKMVRRAGFTVSYDRAFRQVAQACADVHRPEGEWITPAFVEAYVELHQLGYAHSVEVWQQGELAGGLYGVHVDGLFAGESMFYHVSNASKVAFAALVYHLDALGVALFDCQVINLNTYNLGAALVHRDDYLRMLKIALKLPTPFSGQRWPELGCAPLDETPLKDAVDAERRHLLARRGSEDQGRESHRATLERIAPLRFWRVKSEADDADGGG